MHKKINSCLRSSTELNLPLGKLSVVSEINMQVFPTRRKRLVQEPIKNLVNRKVCELKSKSVRECVFPVSSCIFDFTSFLLTCPVAHDDAFDRSAGHPE